MLRPLLCAIGFLTRFPVPLSFDEKELARSAGFFSWVGLLIAGLLWGLSRTLSPLDPRIAALVVVASWAFVTGGLHLDGVADAFDGLSGGRGEAERTLSIMRDSRIGSHGALALLLLVLLKWAALERLLQRGEVSWLIAPATARYAVTALMASFPYARGQGLGSAFVGRVRAPQLALGVLPLIGLALCLGAPSLWGVLAGFCAALLMAWRFQRLLGGLTGDVYGASLELGEMACLVVLALR